jgi:hypothetical protein
MSLLENINKIKEYCNNLQKDNEELLKDNKELYENNEGLYEENKEENNILLNKFEMVNEKLNEKTILNKRLINILTTYRYNELHNIKIYNYEEIGQKNKKLNNEFLKIAKLMKLY